MNTAAPTSELVWEPGGSAATVCPACGDTADKPALLRARNLFWHDEMVTLVTCPACRSRFIADYHEPDYSVDDISDYPLRFYVEQGAGIEQIVRPTFAIASRGEVRRFIDIGCGYGFGVDFAARAFGWDARGIDPSDLARKGAEDLSIRIDKSYLVPGGQHEIGRFDAIVAMEVIEHISEPVAFLKTLRDHLEPGGAIYMSTPTSSVLDNRDHPMLVPVIYAGYHVVVFSRDGLANAMERAGFDNVRVEEIGPSLFASATVGGKPVPVEMDVDRGRYIDYLAERVSLHEPATTPWIGFAYRQYKELVNAGRLEEAEPVFVRIADALREHRGVDLLAPGLLAAEAADADGHLKAGRWPFCLAGLLYLRGIQLINTDWDPLPPLPYFQAAIEIGPKIRASLLEWGADDGDLQSQIAAAGDALKLCEDRRDSSVNAGQ